MPPPPAQKPARRSVLLGKNSCSAPAAARRVGASNLLLEYTLSAAAIARSFTSYAGALLRGDANLLRVPLGSALFQLDVPALLIIVALSGLLAAGTRGGARFNTAVTLLNLAVIAFVFCAGVPRFRGSHFRPFLPLGIRGAFSGASKVRRSRACRHTARHTLRASLWLRRAGVLQLHRL